MPTLVVSSCGTSLLTHGASADVQKALRACANHVQAKLSPDERALIDERVASCAKALATGDVETLRRMSAEANGIVALYDGEVVRGAADVHVLLHTQTYQGARVADVLAERLRALGLNASAHEVPDLQTADLDAFRVGMNELVIWCASTIPGYRDSGYRVVFNVVGGFKAVQGFLQTLGMFYADEVVYLFEGSRELMRIPRLPVDFSAAARARVQQHMAMFRRLAGHGRVSAAEAAGIDETFLFRVGGDVSLSPWGELIWEQVKPALYGEALWPSPSARVRFGSAFVRSVERLTANQAKRVAQINERIDQLARFVDEPAYNPRSLDAKQLRGDPIPPSTHEADAWSDGAAARLFFRYVDEGGSRVLVLEQLGDHL